MPTKKEVENLVKTKTMLAEKAERLAKTVKSIPRKKSMQRQAKKFRQQAENIRKAN